MFGFRNLYGRKSEFVPREIKNSFHVIDGADVYDILCPVSKLTGFRENPLQLLSRVLDPARARLVDSVLQELPTMKDEGNKISDSDALDMIMDRLSIGSPSEDALMRQKLSGMLDVLLPSDVRQEVEQRIEFEGSDVNQAVEESNQ